MLERVISTLRPLTVHGKGFVFNGVTPHAGLRYARVAGSYAMSLDLATVRHAMLEINGPRLVEAGSSLAALIDQLAALGFEPARLVRGRVMPVELDLDPTHEWDRLFVHATALPTAAPDKDRP